MHNTKITVRELFDIMKNNDMEFLVGPLNRRAFIERKYGQEFKLRIEPFMNEVYSTVFELPEKGENAAIIKLRDGEIKMDVPYPLSPVKRVEFVMCAVSKVYLNKEKVNEIIEKNGKSWDYLA